jgi:hypothetical protein
MRYASSTSVSTEKSKGEIERTIKRYGAAGHMFAEKPDAALIEFQMSGKRIRFILPLPDRNAFARDGRGARRSTDRQLIAWEQACRQRWRALALVIKAKLEAVESKITTLEQEFMAHIVLPGGQTVGQAWLPKVDEAYKLGKVPEIGWEG